MDQKSVFAAGTAQPVPRFALHTATATSSPLLTQQLIQASTQPQQQGILSSTVVGQLPSGQSVGGPSPLASPLMPSMIKAPTPGMPSSVGSASSYTLSATPNQSVVTNFSTVGIKTEVNSAMSGDMLQTFLTDTKVEVKTELTNSLSVEDDSKLDVASIGATQQIDQSSVEQEGGPSSMSTDVDECSMSGNNSLLGPSLDVKPDVCSSSQPNPPKPSAKKCKFTSICS